MFINIILYKTIINLYKWLSEFDRGKYCQYIEKSFEGIVIIDDSINYSDFLLGFNKDLKSINNGNVDLSELFMYKVLYKGFSNSSLFISLVISFTISFLQIRYNSAIKLNRVRSNAHSDSYILYQLISLFHCLSSKSIPSVIYSEIIDDMLKYTGNRSMYLLSMVISEKKYNTSLFISGKRVYQESRNKLIHSYDLYSHYLKLKNISYDLSYHYENHIYIQDDYFDKLNDVYINYKSFRDNPDCLLINYYHCIILLDYFFYKDKNKYFIFLDEFKGYLVKLEDIDFNKVIEGNVNIVAQYVYNGLFDEALLHVYSFQKDKRLTPKIHFALDYFKLFIFIYKFEMDSFHNIYIKILSFSDKSYFTNYQPLIAFLHANYCHLKNDFKQSILSLQDASSLISDKSGYGLGIRILELMNFIRWSKHEQMESALINLKNQITFLKKSGTIKPRFIYIYKILIKLHSAQYDYEKCYRLFYEELKLMASADPHWRWDIRSPEVIRFDTWFFSNCDIIPDWDLQLPDPTKNPDV